MRSLLTRVTILSLALLLMHAEGLFAQQFKFDSRHFSSKKTIGQIVAHGFPDTISVETNMWSFMQTNPSWFYTYKIKSVQDFGKFFVNNDTAIYATNYRYQAIVKVLGYSDYAHPNNYTTYNDTLTITYDKDSLGPYQDKFFSKLSGFHKIKIVINDIIDESSNDPAYYISMASPPGGYHPQYNCGVEAEIWQQRYDKSPYGSAFMPNTVSSSYEANKNALKVIFWDTTSTPRPTPAMYELEWTYVDDYGYDLTSGPYTKTTGDLHFDFTNNATRIITDQGFYEIPIVYERGYIVFRTRIVRPDSITFSTPVYTGWSMIPYSGTISTLTAGTHYYHISQAHKSDSLNWQYTVSFAEEGKYKQVMSYFDGTLKNRQTITRFNSDPNDLIATENIYDYKGRPAISILPTPVSDTGFGYVYGLSINSATQKPYTAADFDTLGPPGLCPDEYSLSPLDTSALAYKYYSPLNPDQSGFQKFVPDAKGYPMVHTIIAPENDKHILKQGGAGDKLQMADSNITRYYYVTPDQSEVNRLFGTEVGDWEYYKKTVVSDPNRQTSYSILDNRDRTIATGMIGIGPDSVQHPIDPLITPAATSVTDDLLHNALQVYQDHTWSVTKSSYADISGSYTLQYSVTVPPYPVCNGDIYLTIGAQYDYKLFDQCGDLKISEADTLGQTGEWHSPVNNVLTGTPITRVLDKGPYTVTKNMSYDLDSVTVAVDKFMADTTNCLHNEDYFIRKEVEATDFPCPLDTLGKCDTKRNQMISELWPGRKYGYYGSYPVNSAALYMVPAPWTPYQGSSIFDYFCCPNPLPGNSPSVPPVEYYCGYRYQWCSQVQFPDTVWKNGIPYTDIRHLPVDTFIYIFNDDIARALLPLHPEYCKTCDNYVENYEDVLKSIPDYKTAIQLGYFTLSDIIYNDPMYDMLLANLSPTQAFDSLAYPRYSDRRMDSVAIALAFCGGVDSTQSRICYEQVFNNQLANGNYDITTAPDAIQEQYYAKLLPLYLANRSLRKKIMEDNDTTTHCAPCDSFRMILKPVGVFGPTVFSPSLNDSTAIANVFQPFDSLLSPWMYAAATGNFDLNVMLDSATQTYNDYQVGFCDSQVALMARDLTNCSTDTNVINNIRDSLRNFYCLGAGVGQPYSPNVVRDIISYYGGILGDLCNPYLVNLNPVPTPAPELPTYSCKPYAYYDDAKSFFSRSEVHSCINTHTTETFSLSTANAFEDDIVNALSLASPYTIDLDYEYLDNNLYRLKITDSADNTDTMSFWFKKLVPEDVCAHPLDSLDSWSVTDAVCLKDATVTMEPSLINGYTMAMDIEAVSGAQTSNCRMLVWNDRIALLDTGIALAHDCIACSEIRKVYDDFKDTMNAYGVCCIDHPYYSTMLWNYVNYTMKRQFSSDDIESFIASCALADSTAFRNLYGMIYLYNISSTEVDQIVSHLNTTYDTYVTVFRYSIGSNYYALLSLDNLPTDALLKAKNYVVNDSSALGYSYQYGSSLGNDVLANTFMPTVATSDLWLPTLSSVMGTDLQSVDSATVNLYFTIMNYNFTLPYKLYTINTAPSLPFYKYVKYADTLNSLTAIYGGFNYDSYVPNVNQDYHRQEKKDFLSYNYGLNETVHSMILKKISADSLLANIVNYAGKNVTYDNPYVSNNGSDLFISSNQPTYPGYVIATSVLDAVKTYFPYQPFYQPYNDNAIFFSAQHTRIRPPSPGPSSGDSLNVYRCGDNHTYWYRYFKSNKLYDMYILLPDYIRQPVDWKYVPNSFQVAEGDGNIYRFYITITNTAVAGMTAKVMGYTDFSLGDCIDMQQSRLCLGMYDHLEVPDTTTCERYLLTDAIQLGKHDYAVYMDSVREATINNYIAFLDAHITESLKVTSWDQKYQFTLYYYDRAGNLVRTVPPLGVHRMDSTAPVNLAINTDRDNNVISGATLPTHDMSSFYKYNSINQVVQQVTPDGGQVDYYYDAAGRVVYSQNDLQRDSGTVSYTLYDAQGRIIETGQMNASYINDYGQPVLMPEILNASNFSLDDTYSYILSHTRTEVVATRYDDEYQDLSQIDGMSRQENLRKRVSIVRIFDKLTPGVLGNDTSNYQHATYYSYDISGNVKTLTQEFPGMPLPTHRFKRIDYDYDMLSGKVNMLSYNRGMNDEFYQRYTYDADNRLVKAESSKDGVYWEDDADYEYYKHGPLARVELGDRRVQAMDYAYTIQGWIKAVNGDVADTTNDMGGDGMANSIFPPDVYNYALDYFPGDYNPIGSQPVAHITDVTHGMYNGNITRQTVNPQPFPAHTKYFRYDPLNRITEALYNEIDTANNDSLMYVEDYHNKYTYDANGNISTLWRMGSKISGTPEIMDSMKYTLGSGNQMYSIKDYADNHYGTIDIQKSPDSNFNMMIYDKIGRLVTDKSSTNKNMSWTLYNKLKEVTSDEDDPGEYRLRFSYDGAGNRVTKSSYSYSGDTASTITTDYYVRDASGNILAVLTLDERYAKRKIFVKDATAVLVHDNNGPNVAGPYILDPTFVDVVIGQVMANPSLLHDLLHLYTAHQLLHRDLNLVLNNLVMPPGNQSANAMAAQLPAVMAHSLEAEAPVDMARYMLAYPILSDSLADSVMYVDTSYVINDTTTVDTTVADTVHYTITLADASRARLALGYWIDLWPDGYDTLCHKLGIGTDDSLITDTMRYARRDTILDSTYRYYTDAVHSWAGYILGGSYDSLQYLHRDSLVKAWMADSVLYGWNSSSGTYTGGISGGSADSGAVGGGSTGGSVGGVLSGYDASGWGSVLYEAFNRHMLDTTAVADTDRSVFIDFLDSAGLNVDTLAEVLGPQAILHAAYEYDPDTFLSPWFAAAADSDVALAIDAVPQMSLARAINQFDPHMNEEAAFHILHTVVTSQSFGLSEHHLYGTSRLGIKDYVNTFGSTWAWSEAYISPDNSPINQRVPWYSRALDDFMQTSVTEPLWANADYSRWYSTRLLGLKRYELTSHLGDVQATVLDRTTKVFSPDHSTLLRIHADQHSVTDYYPFGMPMPNRIVTNDVIEANPCFACQDPNAGPLEFFMMQTPDSSLLPDNYPPQQAQELAAWRPWPQDTALIGHLNWLGTGTGLQVVCDSNVVISTGNHYGTQIPVPTDSGTAYSVRLKVNVNNAGAMAAQAYSLGHSGGGSSGSPHILDTRVISASGNYTLNFTAEQDTTWIVVAAQDMDSNTSFTVPEAMMAYRSVQSIPYNVVIPGYYGKKNYRFGYDTQEKVNEIAGDGNHYTALFWEYDPRTALRWNPDPVVKPWESSYSAFGDNPILKIDFLGDDYNVKVTTDDNSEIKKINISSTVYIQGDGASDGRANELTSLARETYKTKEVDGVELSFDVKYLYDPSMSSEKLKSGENLLIFKPESENTYIGMERIASHINGLIDENQIYRTGNTGEILGSGKDNHTIMHETLHLLGLSDRYYESGGFRGKDFKDGNDIMASHTENMKLAHYRNIVNWVKKVHYYGNHKLSPIRLGNQYPDNRYFDRKNPKTSILIDEE